VARGQHPYQKLPGRPSLTLIGTASLWLGPDHLLSVRNLHFVEEYRRFDYADIQAFLLRRTYRRGIWAAVLGGLAALFAFATWSAAPNPLAWIPAVPTALFFALSALNWFRGPACVCHLRTAVHTEPLSSLRRVRPARRALALLRRRVEQVQGRLDRDTVQTAQESGGDENPTSSLRPDPLSEG